MLKIAIVVQGRFHAFDLGRALIARGHDVTMFTNYPRWATRKFGLPDENVCSHWMHGITVKGLDRLDRVVPSPEMTCTTHTWFGRWAAEQTARESWDVIDLFTGVAEETLLAPRTSRIRSLVRGSAHILTQDQLLSEEAARTSLPVERPSPWMIEREQREYQAADMILVLSSFAMQSFIDRGIPKDRLRMLRLGVDTSRFRASEDGIAARVKRIRAGEPLRVLFVGTFSLQKGIADYVAFVRKLDPKRFSFRFVGYVPSEGEPFQMAVKERVDFVPRQPQSSLPHWYSEADIFVFPTLQDGFAAVLAQAHANALPIVSTTNCAGPDMIREGKTGWTLPIRNPDAFAERLTWCAEHREEVAAMVEYLHAHFTPRDWSAVAADFEDICRVESSPALSPGPRI